ncbi:unnamed protein product [Trifolium pratense]|uniref:Uncharacterized protein n=2 Tax=Trifolium pratense TaxID=57577 RepID=A0ACB0LP84_TRIPR|nr:unnamed protein product [Trifolium pratense]CAJ2670227.1 unnamed protein product [Trifolium pratense]
MSSSLLPIKSEPRKRLIIKISYPQKRVNDDSFNDDHSQKRRRINENYGKPIVSCYWLDSTISLSEHNKNKNILSHTTDHQKSFGEENSKVSSKDHPPGTENYGLKKKNSGIAQLMKKEKKKPMEDYKRMQCWVILKRMIEGRDGWALKHPLDPKYLNCLEKINDSKVKPSCLKDIEAKLKSYSTPNEFAEDMRYVFSHGMLYPPSDDVYKIAKRFSDIFENKWKTLKMEWVFEDRRRLNKNIHKRLKVQTKRNR